MKYVLSIFFLFVNVFASCEQTTEEPDITTTTLGQQMDSIQNLINNSSCTGNEQCKYIAYGSKACDGPVGYLIFSSEVDEEALKKMVKAYTDKQKAYNHQNGIMSDCSLPPEPQQLSCENGKCVEIAVTL